MTCVVVRKLRLWMSQKHQATHRNTLVVEMPIPTSGAIWCPTGLVDRRGILQIAMTWLATWCSIQIEKMMTGWWFGTCFFSIIYGIILPIDYIIFFKMVKTTNQQVFLHGFCLEIESNSGTPQKNDQPICQLGTVQHWAVRPFLRVITFEPSPDLTVLVDDC